MKLLDFEGAVVGVGDGYVRLKRDADSEKGWLMKIPTELDEELVAGRHLYGRVRVTVELVPPPPPKVEESKRIDWPAVKAQAVRVGESAGLIDEGAFALAAFGDEVRKLVDLCGWKLDIPGASP